MNRTQRALLREQRALQELDKTEKNEALSNFKISSFSVQRDKYQRALKKKMNADKRGSGHLTLILDELAEVVSDKNSVENHIENKELIKEINTFLGSLSQEKRIMFVRRYWYSDSVADISRRCCVSENNVSVNLNRIRKRLRRYLCERGFES